MQSAQPQSFNQLSEPPWNGTLAAEWQAERLRYLVTLNPSKLEARSLGPDAEVSFVPMEAVGENGGLDLSTSKPLSDVNEGYTYFRDGDVVVAKITPCFENGKGAIATGLSNGVAFGTTELHVLRPADGLDPGFLFYLTLGRPFRELGAATMYGAGGQKRVPEAFIRDLVHPMPVLVAQRAIAAFLDRKTAEIDALVAKKEQLIELLEEKRTALITHAVTKGLEPGVTMKESGVEWLGEIPAHWTVAPVKWALSKVGSGKTPKGGADVYVPEGVLLLRSQNVQYDGLSLEDCAYISEEVDAEMSSSRVREDDVLLNITGASLGRVCVAALDGQRANVSQHVCILRPIRSRLSAKYLASSLASRAGKAQIFSSEAGISRDALNFVQIGDIVVPMPPLVEQEAIVHRVGREVRGLATLFDSVREAINRLKEYRSALITAAVTGQLTIPVTDQQPGAIQS